MSFSTAADDDYICNTPRHLHISNFSVKYSSFSKRASDKIAVNAHTFKCRIHSDHR